MPYRLVVDQKIRNTKNNRYINIDFFDKGIYSLEEINNFTTQFNDEYDFKEYLLDTLKKNGKIYNDAKSGGSCWKIK